MQPIHTPLTASGHPTALLQHLGEAYGPPTLTTLAVRRGGAVEAIVIVHLDDGGREPLSADQARDLAARLCDGVPAGQPLAALADSLRAAASTADRQATAVIAGLASGRGVQQARVFGGRG